MTCSLCAKSAKYRCEICKDIFCEDCIEYHTKAFDEATFTELEESSDAQTK